MKKVLPGLVILIAALSAGMLADMSEVPADTVSVTVSPSVSPSPENTTVPVQPKADTHSKPATVKPKTGTAKPTAKPKAAPEPKPITLYPITGYYSQAAVDTGKLVVWTTNPTCLLAGHDNMGWQWIDDIPVGRTVIVGSGPCSGKYVVYGHKWQPTKGGPIPSWMSGVDAVLQTCTGATGMGFSLLRRIE